MTHSLRLLCATSLLIVVHACSPDAEQTPTSDPGVMQDLGADLARDLGDASDMPAQPDLDTQDAGDMDTPDGTSDMQTDLRDADMPDLAKDMPKDMPDDMADMQRVDMQMADMNGEPLDGFGTLSGHCQVIDTELADPNPSLFRNGIDFAMDPYDESDLTLLTQGGQDIIAAGNAGGNSLLSEVFAFEVLARCEGAALLETETTIDYFNEMGKITDLLVEIDGERVGVSVVRAIAFPFDEPYPASEAERVLNKKLGDIQISTQNVQPQHAWVKQILSVIAYSPQHAEQIEAVYQTLDPSVKSDTIVYITHADGADRPLFFND